MNIRLTALCACLLLAACSTPTTPRYVTVDEANRAIKSVGSSGVGVATFVGPASFGAHCRALGPVTVADNVSHTQYIQKAFERELEQAGAYSALAPRVVISGRVTRLEFSSTKDFTGGYWQIGLLLESSNGARLELSERYLFDSAFLAHEACRNTAKAFMPAVQNLMRSAVRSPQFSDLLR